MFEATKLPRIFGIPPGVKFAEAIVDGIRARGQSYSPHELAKIEIFVNTARMKRSLRSAFAAGPALLVPQIRLISDLTAFDYLEDETVSVSPLRRRLDLARIVSALLDAEPDLGPRSSLYPLADSLADLFEEIESEQIPIDALSKLDVEDQSGYWQRSLKFLNLISELANSGLSNEALLVRAVEKRIAAWKKNPPEHPIFFVGSTASRKTTRELMKGISKLPQGAIVLPGFDFHLLTNVWTDFQETHAGKMPPFEDHPQYRFQAFLDQLNFTQNDVRPWSNDTGATSNRLISLSLQPAPVTDQWMTFGPELGNLVALTKHISLIEAASPRDEAEAIALRLRQAAQNGTTAALVSPDRNLTRQVAAALDRWDLKPDDSAGIPLHLSAPGRLLRHVADGLCDDHSIENLMTLLKHPLAHSDRDDRGEHLRRTRELELELRNKHGVKFGSGFLTKWVSKAFDNDPDALAWASWVLDLSGGCVTHQKKTLADWYSCHIERAETWCAGPDIGGSGELWKESAGRKSFEICNSLKNEIDTEITLSAKEYAALFANVLSKEVVRNRDSGHPNILVLGTLEARVQNSDLVILGGMNETIWPAAPEADPWLNRTLRKRVGLLSPERKIGLSAHDYQQAVAAKEVWITRSLRSSDSETVPSRWVNRLLNLIQGLSDNEGAAALSGMRQRGQYWIDQAKCVASPSVETMRATRPSPRPSVPARPNELSVTQIKTLIRDPFSIYVEKILRVRAINQLSAKPEAQLRGIIFHKILEKFAGEDLNSQTLDCLTAIAKQEVDDHCPWPTTKLLWGAQFERIASRFMQDEYERREFSAILGTEIRCFAELKDLNFSIKGIADRVDLTNDGLAVLYDYKTGALPSKKQQELFDKQLLVEAAMLERGHFEKIPATPVTKAEFIGINEAMKRVTAPLDSISTDDTWSQLEALITNWKSPETGYSARLALHKKEDVSAYDHLSRFGEWSISDAVVPVDLT